MRCCASLLKSTVEAIPEAGYSVDIWPALTTSFVQRTLEFRGERREGVGALFISSWILGDIVHPGWTDQCRVYLPRRKQPASRHPGRFSGPSETHYPLGFTFSDTHWWLIRAAD